MKIPFYVFFFSSSSSTSFLKFQRKQLYGPGNLVFFYSRLKRAVEVIYFFFTFTFSFSQASKSAKFVKWLLEESNQKKTESVF